MMMMIITIEIHHFLIDLVHVMKQYLQRKKNQKHGQYAHDVMNPIFYVEIGKKKRLHVPIRTLFA